MAVVTLDSLRDLAVRGYEGGYTILKSLPAAAAYLSQAVAMGRFETRPDQRRNWTGGRLGGIDINGQKHRLNGFTFASGHSRTMMAERVDQQLVHVPPRRFRDQSPSWALGRFIKSVGHWISQEPLRSIPMDHCAFLLGVNRLAASVRLEVPLR